MAIKDWSTNYPVNLDTNTEQPDLINNEDNTRVSQILSVRDAIQELQVQVGSDNLESSSLRKRVGDLEDAYGPYITKLQSSSLDLIDGYSFEISESNLVINRGVSAVLEIIPTASSGQVVVELFQDSSRSEKIHEYTVDLSDSYTYKSFDSFGFTNKTSGKLYGTFNCSGVSASKVASIELICISMQPISEPTPMVSPYGDGIKDNGFGQPQVALATNSGMEFSSGDLKIKPDITADIYVSTGLNGSFITGAVTNSTDEDISAKKRMDSVGLIPLAGGGPPTSDTWSEGLEILDEYGVKWRCMASGTPGSWDLADTVTEKTEVYSTIALGDGYSEILELDTYGNTGQALWLRVWGKTDSGTSDEQVPFRVRVYETNSGNGREMVWQGEGIIRQTSTSASLPAGQSYIEVSTNDLFEIDEALIIYEDDDRYELGRVSGRTAGQILLEESLEDAGSWDSGSLILGVSEFFNVPWINRDGSPSNQRKIIIELKHNGLSTDPDMVFYVEALAQSRGILK